MRYQRLSAILTLLVVLAACGTTDQPIDRDPPDGGVSDGKVDGATPDAGVADDSGRLPDTSMPAPDVGDAGTHEDASMPVDMADLTPCNTGSRDGVCLPTAECGAGSESVPGFCPGPTDIQCCVAIDDSVCRENPPVDEMPQPNVGLTEAAGDPGCPDGMLAVASFCIDRYEAALMEVLAGGSERPWSPYFNPGTRAIRAVSIEGAVPQAYISGDQARAACTEAGKRLCTDAEWLRACQGANSSVYPYGDTRQPGVCNDARDTHPAVSYFGSSDPTVFSMLGNACIGQQPDTVDPAGSNPGCVSDDGVFDMMGNLHEWTADPNGTFRGGYYVDTFRNGEGCLYRTTAHTTPHWDYSTGFRCCADQ